MDFKDTEKAIKKDDNKVRNYLMKAKIPQSGYMESVNMMIQEERSYAEIQTWLANKGVQVAPNQIAKHKKMLPFLTEVDLTPHEESEIGRIENTKDRLLRQAEMTNVELAIETLQQTIKSSQITAVNDLWGEIIPQMLQNIKDQVKDGFRISFKDTIDGLDKVVKIAQLLENKPTIIQQATVNGNTEVTMKTESIGDGSAESVSSIALDAITQVNNVLQDFVQKRGEKDGDGGEGPIN